MIRRSSSSPCLQIKNSSERKEGLGKKLEQEGEEIKQGEKPGGRKEEVAINEKKKKEKEESEEDVT